MLCQCALAQTGYFASMCLMSPPQQAPTVPLESAREGECVFTFVCVCACVRATERETATETKVPREFLQLLYSGLCVNENVLEGETWADK